LSQATVRAEEQPPPFALRSLRKQASRSAGCLGFETPPLGAAQPERILGSLHQCPHRCSSQRERSRRSGSGPRRAARVVVTAIRCEQSRLERDGVGGGAISESRRRCQRWKTEQTRWLHVTMPATGTCAYAQEGGVVRSCPWAGFDRGNLVAMLNRITVVMGVWTVRMVVVVIMRLSRRAVVVVRGRFGRRRQVKVRTLPTIVTMQDDAGTGESMREQQQRRQDAAPQCRQPSHRGCVNRAILALQRRHSQLVPTDLTLAAGCRSACKADPLGLHLESMGIGARFVERGSAIAAKRTSEVHQCHY